MLFYTIKTETYLRQGSIHIAMFMGSDNHLTASRVVHQCNLVYLLKKKVALYIMDFVCKVKVTIKK